MQNFGARHYDAKTGRFWSVDPKSTKYPMLSSYLFANNSPISGVGINGLEYYYAADGTFIGNVGTNKAVVVVKVEHAKELQYDVARIDQMHKNAQAVDLTVVYKLNVNHDELMKIAAIAYGESSVGNGVKIKEEVYAICNAQVNHKRITGESVTAFAESDGNDIYEKFVNTSEKNRNGTFMQEAVFGAINAVMGGKDYSNGATHWAGNDAGSKKEKWAESLKFTDSKHDLHELGDNILKEPVVEYWKNKKGQNTKVRGSYTYVWESTAAYSGTNSKGQKSGTIFLKLSDDYKDATGSKGN